MIKIVIRIPLQLTITLIFFACACCVNAALAEVELPILMPIASSQSDCGDGYSKSRVVVFANAIRLAEAGCSFVKSREVSYPDGSEFSITASCSADEGMKEQGAIIFAKRGGRISVDLSGLGRDMGFFVKNRGIPQRVSLFASCNMLRRHYP